MYSDYVYRSKIHFHLAHKYVDGPDYGGTFTMNPGRGYHTDEQYAEGDNLSAEISNSVHSDKGIQRLEAQMLHPNTFGGFHLQHTGTIGASATVIKTINLK